MKSTSLFLSLDALFSFARRAFFFLLGTPFSFSRRAFFLFARKKAKTFVFAEIQTGRNKTPSFFCYFSEKLAHIFVKNTTKLAHIFVIFRKNSLIFL